MTLTDLDELVDAEDRVLLEQAVRDHLAVRGPDEDGEAVLLRFAPVFVEGRVSGLCQEGALELFVDAMRAAS